MLTHTLKCCLLFQCRLLCDRHPLINLHDHDDFDGDSIALISLQPLLRPIQLKDMSLRQVCTSSKNTRPHQRTTYTKQQSDAEKIREELTMSTTTYIDIPATVKVSMSPTLAGWEDTRDPRSDAHKSRRKQVAETS